MTYYPAFINLKNKEAVVIGGGRVAERKVKALVKTRALVKVISPDITKNLQKLRNKNLLRHIKRNYKKGDIKDAFIVIACTSSPETNSNIARDARRLVNVVDTPSEGNFIVPSIVDRGALTIAISTHGASPAVSKSIRREIEKLYDREFERYVRFLETVRKKAKRQLINPDLRKKFLKSLASEELFNDLRNRGFRHTSEKILQYLKKIKRSDS